MPIISITQASKLTGKSRQTLYKHLHNGQLSLSTNVNGEKGIDTSELIRVYGQLKLDKFTTVQVDTTRHELTKQNDNTVNIDNQQLTELKKDLALSKLKIEEQQKQLDLKQDTINAKQETIDTLKSALKLLEHKQIKEDVEHTSTTPKKEPKQILSSLESLSIDTIEPVKLSTGFWSRFLNLFK